MPNLFRDVLAAHALRFERPARANQAEAGPRLLLAFAAVGLVVHPALGALFRFAGLGTTNAIFGIGLFFGILYHRSGNLWLPAVMHGMWPLNFT